MYDPSELLTIERALSIAKIDEPTSVTKAREVAELAGEHLAELRATPAPVLDSATVSTAKSIAALTESRGQFDATHPARIKAADALHRNAENRLLQVRTSEAERLRPDLAAAFNATAERFTALARATNADPDKLPNPGMIATTDLQREFLEVGHALVAMGDARQAYEMQRTSQMGHLASDIAEINSRCLIWTDRTRWANPPTALRSQARGIEYYLRALALGCTIRWQELADQMANWRALENREPPVR